MPWLDFSFLFKIKHLHIWDCIMCSLVVLFFSLSSCCCCRVSIIMFSCVAAVVTTSFHYPGIIDPTRWKNYQLEEELPFTVHALLTALPCLAFTLRQTRLSCLALSFLPHFTTRASQPASSHLPWHEQSAWTTDIGLEKKKSVILCTEWTLIAICNSHMKHLCKDLKLEGLNITAVLPRCLCVLLVFFVVQD